MALSFLLYALSTLTVLRYLGKAVRSWAVKNLTALNEFEDLAKPRNGSKIKGAAVIAGGSIAGLLTARVCADHFEQVIIVEPEAWTATDEGVTVTEKEVKEGAGDDPVRTLVNKRARVPQYLSVHVFQCLSLFSLRKMFPAYDAEVKAEGGRFAIADYKLHVSGMISGPPVHDYPFGGIPDAPFISRITYETILRRLVRRNCPNVRIVAGTVTGINPSPGDSSKIASVTWRTKDEDITQDVSLFIDCAGPIAAGLKWLKAAGYGSLPAGQQPINGKLSLDNLTIRYDPKMSYVTAEWPITPELRDEVVVPGGIDNASWLYTYLPIASRDNRSFAVGVVDGSRLHVLCGGWGDVPTVKNPEEIQAFVESANAERPIPAWFRSFLQVLAKHRDLATYESIRIPPCSSIYYSKAVNLPSNFVAVGDSVMRVNPIFGQGCTKSMIGAITLDSVLRTVVGDTLPADFSHSFFALHQEKIDPIWDSTKTPDYGFKSTVPVPGETLSQGAFVRWYSNHLLYALTHDKYVASAFWHVRNFISPPTDLFAPSIAFRVLKQALLGTRV